MAYRIFRFKGNSPQGSLLVVIQSIFNIDHSQLDANLSMVVELIANLAGALAISSAVERHDQRRSIVYGHGKGGISAYTGRRWLEYSLTTHFPPLDFRGVIQLAQFGNQLRKAGVGFLADDCFIGQVSFASQRRTSQIPLSSPDHRAGL